MGKDWRAPSERIRTASEIAIEVVLTDENTVPTYMKISEKVLHLHRLGMPYSSICELLGINRWMALRAARWAKAHHKKLERPFASRKQTDAALFGEVYATDPKGP